MHPLARQILDRDVRALAKAISYIENKHPDGRTILKDLYSHRGKAYLIGLTGPPGAGKSSLSNQLVSLLREEGLTVGVVAVDPSSPFSGGAILGDRVRLSSHYTDEGVFIRSMGTRGSLGGLAQSTKEAVQLIAAFGKEVIIIETVGVGQTELNIVHAVDTVALVLNPGAGDLVQTFKAGIMEIADLYVINKADRPGTTQLKAEINQMLDQVKKQGAWRPPVVETISTTGAGVRTLWKSLQAHRRYLEDSGEGKKRRQARVEQELIAALEQEWRSFIRKQSESPGFTALKEAVSQQGKDPYAAAEELFRSWIRVKGGEED